MSEHTILLQNLWKSYKKWVSSNPQFVSDIESTAKWISYFIAGRISNSSIVSELVYSMSNIIVLLNDRIIEKSSGVSIDKSTGNSLKLMLTTLEYCEVFIEISAKKLWGSKGRWLFIVIVQLVKFMGRYLLLKQHSEKIIRVPGVPVLDRRNIQKQPESCLKIDNYSFFFKLKRSGRVIRKIEGAPPIHLRSWKSLDNELNEGQRDFMHQTAEGLYIAKPLFHLGAVGLFGYKSWGSYCVALLLDFASIRLYYKHRNILSKEQKMELSRRCVNMLLYFVRSPFYEKTSEKHLKSFLRFMGSHIPLMGAICNPLLEYIPHWQDTYFYMWSS